MPVPESPVVAAKKSALTMWPILAGGPVALTTVEEEEQKRSRGTRVEVEWRRERKCGSDEGHGDGTVVGWPKLSWQKSVSLRFVRGNE